MDFSVLIPFKNDRATLERAITSVLSQHGPDAPRFEILLADNGATDGSAAIAKRLAEQAPVPTRVLDATQRPGASHARNVACAMARGKWVAPVDADDWVGEGWLQGLARESLPGRILVAAVSHECEGQARHRKPLRDSGLVRLTSDFVLTAGGHVAFERGLCERAGGWNPTQSAAENHDLLLRLQLEGGRLHCVPNAVYHHSYARSVSAMVHRGWSRAQGNLQLLDASLPLLGAFQRSSKLPLNRLTYRLARSLAAASLRSLKQGHPQPFLSFGEQAAYMLFGRRLAPPAQRMAERETQGVPLRPVLDEPTWPFWRRKAPSQVRFLTFDDGPAPGITDRILDQLGAAGQRATFFVLGRRAAQHPDLVRRMVAEGHEIGNHTYHHYRLHELEPDRLREEIARTQQTIVDIAGVNARPRWFRAPYGRITGDTHLALLEQGLLPARWSIDTVDWHRASSAHSIASAVNQATQPEIFDLHDAVAPRPDAINPQDSMDRTPTIEALAAILRHGGHHGIQFCTLSEVFSPWMQFDVRVLLESLRPSLT